SWQLVLPAKWAGLSTLRRSLRATRVQIAGQTGSDIARAEDDRQFGQASQYQPVAVAPAQRRPWDGQSHGGEAAEQGGERYQALEPGQPGAQAVVNAVAEGQVAGVRPGDVEFIRVVVSGRVPVGRGQRDEHLGEGRDDDPAEGDVLGGVPERRVRHGRVPPQDFLDRVRYQGWVGDECVALFGVQQQGDCPVA